MRAARAASSPRRIRSGRWRGSRSSWSATRPLWFEDLIDLCAAAMPTETQVMVKREDEQAFAELNGANPIFVEDAVRLLCAASARPTRGSATSGWWRAIRSCCTATTRCRS